MEVILLQDVKSLGKEGDIVKVNDGYARNFILPKKLVVEANAKNLNDLKIKKEKEAKIAKEIYEQAKALGEAIEKESVTVKMKLGKDGRSFGSVSTKEIAQAAKEQLGRDIDKKKMALDVPIKTLGVYNVTIKLHPKVTTTLKVKVEQMN
ncbi:MAG: 50S ribosomal protein L9 [Lachnospiraceae bacterium]|nr:50S ribosomal protein L9 [Lachnospiraceae bacterium]